MNTEKIQQLKAELEQARQQSLQATRRGDYLAVARLTARTAELNREISQVRNEDAPVLVFPRLAW